MTPAKTEFKGSVILERWRAERQMQQALQKRAQKQSRMIGQGFSGAAIDRLSASLSQWSGSVNADLDSQLVILRSRARALCANNEFARRFLSLTAGNIIGCGPKLQVRAKNLDGSLDKAGNDAIEWHWDKWGCDADASGRMTLSHLLRVAVKSIARDGETLIKVVRNRSLPYGMALQLLEADRLDVTINARLDNGNMIRQGVEVDSMLRPIAYHIRTAHPGENYHTSPVGIERVLAKDVYHIFLQERAEQVRGYTWLHAVLARMNMLHAYEEAAVVAARVGASKMGFLTRKDEAPSMLETIADQKDTAGNLTMSAEPGEFTELPAGYSMESWNPEYPHNNFESFLKQCLRGVASGLDVATHNLSGDMTDVNYSSARIAELAERDMWKALQDWLHEALLEPLYKDWLASGLLRGDITMLSSGKQLPAERLQKFIDVSRFQGRRWSWVDPLKEVEASAKLIEAGLASRTEIAASQGREFDDVMYEQAEEQKLADSLGITLNTKDAATVTSQGNSSSGDAPAAKGKSR